MKPQDFKAWRSKYRITQTHAARMLHTTERTVQRWERGQVALDGPARAFCEAFELLSQDAKSAMIEKYRT